MDSRHLKRIETVQQLYSSIFAPVPLEPYSEKTQKVLAKQAEIDEKINEFAAKHSTEKIAKTDLSILRLGVYDLLHEADIPPRVTINEAVDLAKEMGGDKSPGFINAVLGQIYTNYCPQPTEEEEKARKDAKDKKAKELENQSAPTQPIEPTEVSPEPDTIEQNSAKGPVPEDNSFEEETQTQLGEQV
jgi:transcription antitermination factor NusB